MAGRAALNLAVSAYLHSVTAQSSRPGATRALAGILAGLTVVDGATGLTLRRSERA
jgi:hypothetical protein